MTRLVRSAAVVALGVIAGLPTLRTASAQEHGGAASEVFRPPAVPLVTFDPYLSVWSETSRLADSVTRHWTRSPHSLISLIRVDGKTYRLMGKTPTDATALPQTGVKVFPTRSVYNFDDGHVHVTLTFMTPALMDDLDALSLPLSYITWEVKSVDGVPHAVSLFDSTSSQLAVNDPKQQVQWAAVRSGTLSVMRAGTVDQPLLSPAGDNTRIDWGYVYTAAPASQAKQAAGAEETLTRSFVSNGQLPAQDDGPMPRASDDREPVLAFAMDLGKVAAAPVSRHVIVAYDEIYSINYFGKKLRPYWRRNGATPEQMLESADRQYPDLTARCAKFDDELITDLTRAGGTRYAQIAALAYRECLAGCGLAADANGQPLLFTKENTSNGDIATVDVIFPMEPMMLLLSPTLAKASLVSNLMYSASPHWKFPNAPHDLGTYPVVTGRDDGGEGMPVEESGNMLILCDAIARADGNADFVKPWWPQLTQWAGYLEQYGLDPGQQLCTDDFMGHLAHNANLSVKAILGLAAYGDLCRMRGQAAEADRYARLARADAAHWQKVADAGDHSLLAFDKPGTWSQKYNLVWDRLLGLGVFPPQVAAKEVAFYKTVLQQYGLPLDSRTKLTKSDWSIWSATMAEDPADFRAIVSPIWDYLDQTTVRDPIADSYITTNVKSGGMHARPVVGGFFIKMLADPAVWKKWSSRDKTKTGTWAPLPTPPALTTVVPDSGQANVVWRYTLDRPAKGWAAADFDDSGWKQAPGPFASPGTRGIKTGTPWKTDDIWLRRDIVMPQIPAGTLQFNVFHDEDVEIYVNGVLAARDVGFVTNYQPLDIGKSAIAQLKPGAKITLAVHCHQTSGGQGIDVGIVTADEK